MKKKKRATETIRFHVGFATAANLVFRDAKKGSEQFQKYFACASQQTFLRNNISAFQLQN